MPEDAGIDGSIELVPPPSVVYINGAPAGNVLSWEATQSTTKRGGSATVRLADPQSTLLSAYSVNQEVLVYVRNASDVLVKIFGGVIDSLEYDVDDRAVFIVKCRDWLSKFLRRIYDTSHTSTEISVIVDDILQLEADITRSDVTATSITLNSFSPDRENAFNSLTKLSDVSEYKLWVTPDKAAHFKGSGSLSTSTDVIEHTSNLIAIRKTQDQTELWNDVTVFGRVQGQSANYVDASSVSTYGSREASFISMELSNVTDLTVAATAIVTARKNPRTIYECETRLLFDAQSGKKIAVTYPRFSLSSTSLEIIEITWVWGDRAFCKVVLGDLVPSLPHQVAKMARDLIQQQIQPSQQTITNPPAVSIATAGSVNVPAPNETTIITTNVSVSGAGYLVAHYEGTFAFSGTYGYNLYLDIGGSRVYTRGSYACTDSYAVCFGAAAVTAGTVTVKAVGQLTSGGDSLSVSNQTLVVEFLPTG